MDIRDALDEFQLPFARDSRRALRLLAPAGSGKTHSLLWRCLYQWESATNKPRFLLFTFTKAARDELRDRLRTDPHFSQLNSAVEVTTLNSWGFRRLKSRMHSLKLITSPTDTYFAVQNSLQPVWSKDKKLQELMTGTMSRNRTAKVLLAVIDGMKSLGFRHDVHHQAAEFRNHLKWLRDVGLGLYFAGLLQQLMDLQILNPEAAQPDEEFERRFLPFWRKATVSLHDMAMLTLEDQKYWAWLDLEEAIAEKKFTTGIHRTEHVLVDEFQDVNCLDLRLLQSIATVNKAELTLVGDDDQAIYEWRGASPQFILAPDQHVGGGYATHILDRNYRSPRNIVELSQRLIKNNTRRVAKNVQAASTATAIVEVWQMPGISQCIDFVLKEVRAMLDGKAIKRVALISRKRGQIIPYQIVFASHNIPFYAAEDLQVFLSDAFDALKNILGIKARAGAPPMPGLDPIADLMTLVDKVKRYPLNKTDRAALLKHLKTGYPKTLTACVASLRLYTGPLKGNNEDARMANAFADAVLSLINAPTVAAAVHAISESFEGLRKDYGKSLEDVFYTDPPFMHLAEFAERYGNDYSAFYEDLDKATTTLARLPNEEESDDASKREPEWKLPLHLMTALRAKGKEFDAVIILDVNRDIWPIKLSTTPEQLEQERRVFYVAFTRARKRLTLLVNNSILGQPAVPSPYLAEMGLTPKVYSGT